MKLERHVVTTCAEERGNTVPKVRDERKGMRDGQKTNVVVFWKEEESLQSVAFETKLLKTTIILLTLGENEFLYSPVKNCMV